MNVAHGKRGIAIFALAASLFMIVFATSSEAGKTQPSIAIEIVKTNVASVSEAKVVQDVDSLVVSGKVWKMHKFFLAGHVDIVICDKNGKKLVMGTPRIKGYASKRGGEKVARFSERFNMSIPDDSKVKLRYHTPASEGSHLSCA